MNILQPAGLAFLALIPILISFYILKLRRQNVPVSSTLLWEQVLRDMNANHPWQRLRRNLLLLLQLLVMLLIIFALARPYLHIQAQAGGHSMVVLLDASASMSATDVAPNRLEVAKRQVSQLIDDLPDGQQMTLIRVAGAPEVLVSASADKTALHTALSRVEQSGSKTNMADALNLGVTLSRLQPNTEIVLVSDGNISDVDSVKAMGQIPIPVRYIPIGMPKAAGDAVPNQGITAFVARPSPDRIGEYEAFVRITNYDDKAVKVNLSIEADGQLAQAKSIEIAAHQSTEETFADFPLGVKLLHARISGNESGDVLPADNNAWALATAGVRHRVLLASDSNQFLEKALSVLPGIDLWKVGQAGFLNSLKNTSSTGAANERYDLTIVDGFIPDTLPPGNLLIFNPPTGNKLIEVTGDLKQPAITDWQRNDPLLRYVDLGNVRLDTARAAKTPGWGRSLIDSDSNPLMVAGTLDGRRIVIFNFDLHKSNLPLQLAYPLLVANVTGWLTSGGATDASGSGMSGMMLAAGQAVDLPAVPKADNVVIEKPDKTTVTLPVRGDQNITFTDTDELGVYTIVYKAGNTELDKRYAAVNLNDERESNIATQPSVALGNQNLQQSAADVDVAREVWFWFALAGLLFVMLEWWWYHQRG